MYDADARGEGGRGSGREEEMPPRGLSDLAWSAAAFAQFKQKCVLFAPAEFITKGATDHTV
jgi:hypothetical protein